MNIRAFLLPALLLLACGAQAAEKYYKWKDEAGVWHYTRTPPPAGAQAENVKVKTATPAAGAAQTPPSSDATATAASSATPAGTGDISVASNADRTAQCEKAKAYLETVNDNPYLASDNDGDGEPELMSEEQRAREIDRAQAAVKLACE